MSVANYDACSYNHSEILICIQTIGSLQENVLVEALTKIKKHSKLVIPDAGRTVQFRFEVSFSKKENRYVVYLSLCLCLLRLFCSICILFAYQYKTNIWKLD